MTCRATFTFGLDASLVLGVVDSAALLECRAPAVSMPITVLDSSIVATFVSDDAEVLVLADSGETGQVC